MKLPSNPLKIGNGLVLLLRVGTFIWQKWVNLFQVCALVDGQEVDIGSATSIPVIWSVDASTGNVVMVYAGGAGTPIT